ncbi:MAG: hypothetical protein ACTHOK_20790 [Nocardioidaceae bacterium]
MCWRGLVSYAAGLLVMIPFFSLSFYTGPVAERLGGADVSFVVGLRERRARAASQLELEGTPVR